MFYSHEILTSRKYGVATVWLVATLGAKSSTKKVNRKAILGVDVSKACETIIQPAAPMALRLQSNLLYGVARVFDQQCSYVLADSQTAQANMRALLKVMTVNALDPAAGRARPDQLILMDDPAFLPEMTLPFLDFNYLDLNHQLSQNTIHGSQLSPSSHNRQASASSRDGSVLGLIIPTSDTGGIQLPFGDHFQVGGSSVHKTPAQALLYGDDDQFLLQDIDFEFDADGVMHDVIPASLRSGPDGVTPQYRRPESDSAASGRVWRDHEQGLAGHGQHSVNKVGMEGDFVMNLDDEPQLPDAEAFPTVSKSAAVRRTSFTDSANLEKKQASSEAAQAPLKRRKRRALQGFGFDPEQELNNRDLRNWQLSYVEDQKEIKNSRGAKAAKAQAKKNAYAMVFGNGIGGVGRGIGSTKLDSPLIAFAGDSLRAMVTGKTSPVSLDLSTSNGHKRARLEDADHNGITDSENRRVRQRLSEDGLQIGRGADDEGLAFQFDDSTGLEVGRVAPPTAHSALDDHLSSALMPWNVSVSLHSHRAGSSVRGRGLSAVGSAGGDGRRHSSLVGGRAGSRLTSASPLVGRGRYDSLGEIERVDDIDLQNPYADSFSNHTALFQLRSSQNRGHSIGGFADALAPVGTMHEGAPRIDEFERYGPAEAVDTQTAGTSQFLREAMARECMNLFQYVRNTIEEIDIDKEGDLVLSIEGHADKSTNDRSIHEKEGKGEKKKSIMFETLINPLENNALVAAQAFLHVLTLATRGLLWVKQEDREDGMGYIWLGIKRVPESASGEGSEVDGDEEVEEADDEL